jgi:DNA-3-methyladenine glycosylase
MNILPPEFYERPTLTVARELLGKRLVRILDGVRLAGIICEAEAYIGEQDLACHARSGKTRRNAVMYGSAGMAYVYFTYGHHWMLNAVTEREGFPAAVLLRGIEPIEAAELILQRRNGRDTYGPGKLTQALGIDGGLNGASLGEVTSGLWIEGGGTIRDEMVETGPRVGLFTVPEPWLSRPWRYRIKPDFRQSCREL